MTCLPCSRSIRVDGWQRRVLQPLLGRWTTIRSAADPSLSLGRGRPEERGVPVTSTDDFDRDINEKKIFTTSDALQTTGAKCNHGSASIWHRFDSICRQLRCFYSSLQANSVVQFEGSVEDSAEHGRRALDLEPPLSCMRYNIHRTKLAMCSRWRCIRRCFGQLAQR